jgi:hypothetical protein
MNTGTGDGAATLQTLLCCGYGFRAPAFGRPRNDIELRVPGFA